MDTFKTSNLRPVYSFLATAPNLWDGQNILVSPKVAIEEYKKYKRIKNKERVLNLMKEGRVGRPKGSKNKILEE